MANSLTYAGQVSALFGAASAPTLSITSLTSSGTTATATTSSPHGLSNGAVVAINGAAPDAYNGYFVITVTGASTFTYTFVGGSSPATGTITAIPIGTGGIANNAVALRLYQTSSTPQINGQGFVEVASGNGYTTGGIPITKANWTVSQGASGQQIVLADQSWSASGGTIPNVAGAYLTDVGGNVLAWWAFAAPLTVPNLGTLQVHLLTIQQS